MTGTQITYALLIIGCLFLTSCGYSIENTLADLGINSDDVQMNSVIKIVEFPAPDQKPNEVWLGISNFSNEVIRYSEDTAIILINLNDHTQIENRVNYGNPQIELKPNGSLGDSSVLHVLPGLNFVEGKPVRVRILLFGKVESSLEIVGAYIDVTIYSP